MLKLILSSLLVSGIGYSISSQDLHQKFLKVSEDINPSQYFCRERSKKGPSLYILERSNLDRAEAQSLTTMANLSFKLAEVVKDGKNVCLSKLGSRVLVIIDPESDLNNRRAIASE